VIDTQSTLVFMTNQNNHIVLSNKKFLEYFKLNNLFEIKERNLKIYQYSNPKYNSYDDLYENIYHHDHTITIGKDTFFMKAHPIEVSYKLFTLSKITSIYNEAENLQVAVTIDPLTQTYRKAHFDTLLAKELAYEHSFALAVLDIDNFKTMNDEHGHIIGDSILKTFVSLMRESLKKEDIIARWGGDEFIILLQDSEHRNVWEKIDKLRQNIQKATFAKNVSVTTSIGIAISQKNDTVESLLQRADEALYEAKNNAKNNTVLKK